MSENEQQGLENTAEEAANLTDNPTATIDNSALETGNLSSEEPAAALADVSEQADESTQADSAEPVLPAHFEAIPQEKLKRAKRTRRILLLVIILLFLILAAAVAGAAYYYLNYGQEPAHINQPSVVIATNEEEVQDRGTAETIEMPNLVQMFGKTPQEVVTILGPDYTITKVDAIEEEEPADTDEGSSSTDASATEDTPSTDASESISEDDNSSTGSMQVATISYSPKEQTGSIGSAQVQNLYLTLNESGVTVEIFFVSSMNLLDFHISSFADLVGTKTMFVDTLASAGATVAPDAEYTSPATEEYTEYVDPEASIIKVRKETFSWAGRLASEQAPTTFEITFTYDFGATGVEDKPDRQPTQRMLYIKLV